eukprot:GHVS01005030.1.p1 GENE.GHVS01005030.1~~GHVS01005030.1.p1  ORF type:complete len:657 (+),score=147.64 GHVS01005030.1:365-2335(+)
MLSSLAEKLFSSRASSDSDVSPGGSTVASGGDQAERAALVVEELICSVWVFVDNDAKVEMEEASISLEEDKVVFIADGGKGGGKKKDFLYADIVSFRQNESNVFQWLVKKNGAAAVEFGIVFPTAAEAEIFNPSIRAKIRATAEVVSKEAMVFEELVDKEWQEVEGNATMVILQRPKDKEGFFYVCDAEEKVLAEVGLSSDSVLPAPKDEHIIWWGVVLREDDSSDRKMFKAKFGDGMLKSFEAIEKVMTESHQEGESGQDYDKDDFLMETARGEEDIEWLDAEEEIEADAVLSRDTTRRKAAENPGNKLHKMMFVGRNRTFVVRGGNSSTGRLSGGQGMSAELQVMKIGGEGEQELVGTIPEEKLALGDQQLCPNKGLLHDNETKMMLLDESDNSRIYMLDVDREKVVQSWSAGGVVDNILPCKDKATRDPTFLGTNSTSLFTVDTRLSSTEVAQTTNISYATNVQFTCGATDEAGHILLGSKLGDMRLYDGEANKDGKFKRAKTHLAGLGEPLLHVAVTKDGSWILGTCAKYLVLFPVKLSSSGKTGFQVGLGKSKPPPVVLKMTLEDVFKYKLSDVNFTKAEFNDDESAIVSSTGSLAVIWKFSSAVANGGTGGYIVRAVDDYIKEVDFVKNAGKHESIVMATPCEITTKNIL